MTNLHRIYPQHYLDDWSYSVSSSNHQFLFPLEKHTDAGAKAMRTLFAPAAGAFYIYQPSKRRRVFNKAADMLEEGNLPGFEYAISFLYDKYCRNHSISSISQTGHTLYYFLIFLSERGRQGVEEVRRKDIAAYVEHEQERGLKVNSVRNHLHTVYAFLKYLVNNDLLPAEILLKKIRLQLPDILPKAIPYEDLQKILFHITKKRDRALILLLLHTGMRIGELLQVKMTDIVFSERKILLFLGEKNLQGRVVYYSETAEKALNEWLEIKPASSSFLICNNRGRQLSYVSAWMVMKEAVERAGLQDKGYSLHSLRHSFATNMLNAGMRLEVLQQLLGHQTIDMTLRYARISNVTREESYFRAMEIVEKGGGHEHDRVNSELQAVFEEKELL